MDLQRQGREAYERQNYSQALSYFTRAVGKHVDPSVQLLDSLSATHYKLNDLPAALKAAKKAIQAGREDPTGYLRAGVVLRKMKNLSVALEIYAYGLRSIRHVGQGFEQLKKVHDELVRELAPTGSVDPLTVLPRELALYILQLLDFRQRVAVCRVSKAWSSFVKSEPSLWSHLDLSAARRKVPNRFISTAINTAKSKLTRATLHQLYDFDKVMAAVAPRVDSLVLMETGLQVSDLATQLCKSKRLRELSISKGTQTSSKALASILTHHSQTLEVLEYDHPSKLILPLLALPNLTTLHLHAKQIPDPSQMLADISGRSTSLRSLTLRELAHSPTSHMSDINLRGCSKLTFVDLRLPLGGAGQLHLPASVQTLRLSSMAFARASRSTPDLLEIDTNALQFAGLPLLQDFKLEVRWTTLSTVLQQLNRNPNAILNRFTQLSLCFSYAHDTPFEVSFSDRFRDLVYLDLDEYYLKDDHVAALLGDLPKLQYLGLNKSQVTGVAVKHVVNAGHVRELSVCDCAFVGRDAVEWGRSQGLRIYSGTTNSTIHGRSVRYG